MRGYLLLEYAVTGFIIGCLVDLLFFAWQYKGILQPIRDVFFRIVDNKQVDRINRTQGQNKGQYEEELNSIAERYIILKPLVCNICFTFWIASISLFYYDLYGALLTIGVASFTVQKLN